MGYTLLDTYIHSYYFKVHTLITLQVYIKKKKLLELTMVTEKNWRININFHLILVLSKNIYSKLTNSC
jgi:hypothetical protein